MIAANRFVFINCPFDSGYQPIFQAICFAILACGYVPRCALEVIDSGQSRLDKILDLIDDCDFSVHDISRTEPDPRQLPRFNMPFELGLAFGCNRFSRRRRRKPLLVLDRDPYRYKEFLSDLSGHDPQGHGGNPDGAIAKVRDWLSSRQPIPVAGAAHLTGWYRKFLQDLPLICNEQRLSPDSFIDLNFMIRVWLQLYVPLA